MSTALIPTTATTTPAMAHHPPVDLPVPEQPRTRLIHKEDFDRVTFTLTAPAYWTQVNQSHDTQVLRDPQWKRITKADVEGLIGEPYIAPELGDE